MNKIFVGGGYYYINLWLYFFDSRLLGQREEDILKWIIMVLRRL